MLKYRKKLIYFNIALFCLYISFFSYKIFSVPEISLNSFSDFFPFIAFIFFIYLFITYLLDYQNLIKAEKEVLELEKLLHRQGGELAAKDALLQREKEILLTKHEQLIQMLDKQKTINLENEKLRRNYERIISLNNSIWFMSNPIDIIEEISQNSIESTNALRCLIFITSPKGEVEFCGSSLITAEEKKTLKELTAANLFSPEIIEEIVSKPYIKLEKNEFIPELFSFLDISGTNDIFLFPIRFRNSFRGAAFYVVENSAKFISENLVTAEMFLSIISVYFERNDLIKKEFELSNIISEKEKMNSINNLIEGIAHNLNSPLNTISLSQEMNAIALNSLKQKYPEEKAIDNLIKASERIGKAATSINGIISNFTQKSMLDKKEVPEFFSINDLIKNEIVFLEADMTFKHKILKELSLGDNIPAVFGLYRDFSYLFEAYVFIIINFLEESEEKKIIFKTSSSRDFVHIDIVLPKSFNYEKAAQIFNDTTNRYISGQNINNVKATRDKYEINVKFIPDNENIVIRASVPTGKKS